MRLSLNNIDLEVGETSRTTCPFCHAKEQSFTITRVAAGLIYNCYRASCPSKAGFEPTIGVPRKSKRKVKEFKPREFNYALEELPENIYEMFYSKYDISRDLLDENEVLWSPVLERVAIPIRNYLGYVCGMVARTFEDNPQGAKAISYWFNDTPKVYYPNNMNFSGGEVSVVEDPISAMKLNEFTPTAALLGTHMSEEMVFELRKRGRNLNILLDADTWKDQTGSNDQFVPKATKLKNKYNLYFNKINTPVLEQDIKDTPVSIIIRIMEKHGISYNNNGDALTGELRHAN